MALRVESDSITPRRAGPRRALVRRSRRRGQGGRRGRQPQPAPALVRPSRGHRVVRADRLRPRRAGGRDRRQPGGQDARPRTRSAPTSPHWLLVDISPDVTELPEGAGSTEIVVGGKPTRARPSTASTGVNSYTDFLADDPDMEGTYGHYDGPFPPFNDERLHHYHFIVYALDVPSLGLEGEFKLDDVRVGDRGPRARRGRARRHLHAERRDLI